MNTLSTFLISHSFVNMGTLHLVSSHVHNVIKKGTKYSGQYTRVGWWVQLSEIHCVSNGQKLVIESS
jgi:hypothetical protein